jgi:hypothetical protein
MKRKAVFLWSALAIAAIGVAYIAQRPPIQPGYVLEHNTVQTHGIRLGYKTTYRLLKDGALIWEKETRDKYLDHWITPEGRVWTLAGSYSGPGSGGHLTVRDIDGAYEAIFSVDYLVGNGLMPGPDPTKMSEWSTARIEQPRGDDSVESLTIDRDGKPFRHLVLRSPEAGSHQFDQVRSRLSTDGSFEGALFDGDRPLPKPVSMIGEGTWVWRSNEDYWVVSAHQSNPPTSLAQSVGTAHRVPGVPDSVQRLPSGRRVWLVMEKGVLAIFDRDYKHLGDTYLVKLGSYSSIEEAKKQVSVLSMKIKRGNAWVDADKSYATGDAVYVEQFDFSTYDGRRLVWTIKSYEPESYSITTKVLDGLDARYPKEPGYIGYKLLEEKTVGASSGRFILRLRKFYQERRHQTSWAVTLVSNEQDDQGRSIPIEVWSRTEYNTIVHALVSDSGRVAIFKCGTIKSYNGNDARYVPQNMVYLFDQDRDNLTAQRLRMWVNGKELDYVSPEEAVSDTVLSSARFISSGQPSTTTVDGLELPVYPIEILEIHRKSGPPVHITITPDSVQRRVVGL